MSRCVSKLAQDMGLLPEWVTEVVNNAPNNYKLLKIPKNSTRAGKKEFRTIYQPAVESKMIQRWLLHACFSKLPVSSISTAFDRGSSILKNAQVHRTSKYSVRVDLKDFFPSIKSSDLRRVLVQNNDKLPDWAGDESTAELIEKTCFLPSGALPIGFPSSPRIANVVMFELDQMLVARVKSSIETFGIAALSRYADDYVFSTDRKGACTRFIEELTQLLRESRSPKLSVNTSKTRLMTRESGSTLITGLRVKPTGEIGVHARYKDEIRLLLHLFSSGRLKNEDLPTLRGHLSFVRHSDPGLYTRLARKFTKEIAALQTGREGASEDMKLAA